MDEDGYDWMDEQPDYKATLGRGLLSKLENIEEFVEKVNTIVSTGVEVQENTNELIENSQNLKASLDEFKTEKTEQEQADKETSKAPEVVEVSELLEPASEEDTNEPSGLFGNGCKYLCIDKAKNSSHTKPSRANILCGSIITSSSMLLPLLCLSLLCINIEIKKREVSSFVPPRVHEVRRRKRGYLRDRLCRVGKKQQSKLTFYLRDCV